MPLLDRDATAALRRLARGFAVVAVTGPRQSGETNLVRDLQFNFSSWTG